MTYALNYTGQCLFLFFQHEGNFKPTIGGHMRSLEYNRLLSANFGALPLTTDMATIGYTEYGAG